MDKRIYTDIYVSIRLITNIKMNYFDIRELNTRFELVYTLINA